MDDVVCLISIEDSTADSVDNIWTVDSIDDDWTVNSLDKKWTFDPVNNNWTVDLVDDNWTVDSVDDNITVDPVDDNWAVDIVDDSRTVDLADNWTVDSIDDKWPENSVDDNWNIDSNDDNWTVDSVEDNWTVDSAEIKWNGDSVDNNWVLKLSEVDNWTVGSVDDNWSVCSFDDNWTVEFIESGIIVCVVSIKDWILNSLVNTGLICSVETIDVVGSGGNVDDSVDLTVCDDNTSVWSIGNEDKNVVSKGCCESEDNIATLDSVITIDAIESLRETIKSVYIDDPDDSDDEITTDLVEIYDDVDSVNKFETVCAVESDAPDGVFDNEAVSYGDNKSGVVTTDCEKVESINTDSATVDVENNTDDVNSLTNDGIIDFVSIADVVETVYIDADGAKSIDTSNEDEFWAQSASVFAQ